MPVEHENTMTDEPISPIADPPVAPGEPGFEDLPVRDLVDLLNEAFEVELDRRRASLIGDAPVVDPDSGVRAARGQQGAGGIGMVVWAGIVALLVAVA